MAEDRDDVREDIRRLETKVDKLTDAIGKLILFEERQANQGERIGKVETAVQVNELAINKVDKKVEMWVNRGIGVWIAAAILFTIVQVVLRVAK